MKETLERYAELKLIIKEAEKELETIQPTLKEAIEVGQVFDIGVAKISMNQGKPRWTYSAPTQEEEERLKAKKKAEEQLGVAVATYGEPFLTCTFPKK